MISNTYLFLDISIDCYLQNTSEILSFYETSRPLNNAEFLKITEFRQTIFDKLRRPAKYLHLAITSNTFSPRSRFLQSTSKWFHLRGSLRLFTISKMAVPSHYRIFALGLPMLNHASRLASCNFVCRRV